MLLLTHRGPWLSTLVHFAHSPRPGPLLSRCGGADRLINAIFLDSAIGNTSLLTHAFSSISLIIELVGQSGQAAERVETSNAGKRMRWNIAALVENP
jgi:hypothetical protein